MGKRASATKPGREAYWFALENLANAILDAEQPHISSLSVNLTQHGGSEQFYGYIEIKAGELTEDRYDALRSTVNSLGGAVNLIENPRVEGANVRIWPIAQRA